MPASVPALYTGLPIPQALAVFRNTCGRRGCGHVFEFAGPNVLENISHLVSQHAHSCPGRGYRLWRPNSVVHSVSFQSRKVPISLPFDDQDAKIIVDARDDDDSARSASPLSSSSAHSGSVTSARDGSSGSGRASTSSSSNTQSQSLLALPVMRSSRRRGHKSARTEEQRIATLETDPLIVAGSVTPHEVVCRGCERKIKLDRRSRYYPGLWEKHRERCEEVKNLRQAGVSANKTTWPCSIDTPRSAALRSASALHSIHLPPEVESVPRSPSLTDYR